MPMITQKTIFKCPDCGTCSTVAEIDAATQQYLNGATIASMVHGELCWFVCPACGNSNDFDDWVFVGEAPAQTKSEKRKRVHKCVICGYPETTKVDGIYLCQHCQKPQNYSFANWKTTGRKTKKPAFSIEFETDKTPSGIFELVKHKYVPTKDASIGGYEWKSPIYHDLSSFKKVLPILEKYTEAVTSACGTHVHVSISIFSKVVLIEHWDKAFNDIIDYIKLNKNTARKFWGRYFNDYCSAIGPGHHSAFSPSEKYDTLEYRLPRFVTAEQYYTVVKFCREATEIIDAFLKAERTIHHVNYPDEMPRTSVAQAGDILLKLYQKYEEKIQA